MGPDGTPLAPVPAGVTPVHAFHLARGDYLLRVTRDGYAPIERLTSSAWQRSETPLFGGPAEIVLDLRMLPVDSAPPGMVLVPGGPYQLVSHAAPRGAAAELDPFHIDRFEVTNEDFLRFIQEGRLFGARPLAARVRPRWPHALVR